jgi:Zn-dependent alcohol dehydrogenase
MRGDIAAYSKALVFLGRHRERFDWDRMLGRRYGLGEVNDALEAMRSMREIKPIVDPAVTR